MLAGVGLATSVYSLWRHYQHRNSVNLQNESAEKLGSLQPDTTRHESITNNASAVHPTNDSSRHYIPPSASPHSTFVGGPPPTDHAQDVDTSFLVSVHLAKVRQEIQKHEQEVLSVVNRQSHEIREIAALVKGVLELQQQQKIASTPVTSSDKAAAGPSDSQSISASSLSKVSGSPAATAAASHPTASSFYRPLKNSSSSTQGSSSVLPQSDQNARAPSKSPGASPTRKAVPEESLSVSSAKVNVSQDVEPTMAAAEIAGASSSSNPQLSPLKGRTPAMPSVDASLDSSKATVQQSVNTGLSVDVPAPSPHVVRVEDPTQLYGNIESAIKGLVSECANLDDARKTLNTLLVSSVATWQDKPDGIPHKEGATAYLHSGCGCICSICLQHQTIVRQYKCT